jgi:lactoylglutathione lyase
VSSEAPRPVLAQLENIALATDDVEGLRDFYLQLGGLASPPSTDPNTNLDSCVVDFCGVRLEFVERAQRGKGALGSADAVDELTGVIIAAGYRVLELPHRTCELGCYESVVLDPDGNRLKLTV